MSYREQMISQDILQKHVENLDSDEGIRIENEAGLVFINKISRRYYIECIKDDRDEFTYATSVEDVLKYLSTRVQKSSKVFLY